MSTILSRIRAFTGTTDKVLSDLGQERQVVLSIPSFLSLVDILKNSDLSAVVRKRLVRNFEGLTIVNLPFHVSGFTKIMVWHERIHESVAHQWLRSLIFEVCNEF